MKILEKTLLILLILNFFLAEAENQKKLTKCHKHLIESFNLNSYTKPRLMNMYICPALKQSCCSIYDQFMMYQNWKHTVRPRLAKYYKGLADKIEHTTLLVEQILKLDLKKMIQDLKMTDKEKAKVQKAYDFIKLKKPLGMMTRMPPIQAQNTKNMLKIRSSFYCTICDFKNHPYFDLKNKILDIDQNTCQMIAEDSINYSYMINVMIAPALMKLTEVTSAFSLGEKKPPVKIKTFKSIFKNIQKCGSAFKQGMELGAVCKDYCSYYNFNANSPVIEGYQLFFNDLMNTFTKFLQDEGHRVVEPDRILEIVKTTKKLTKERHLEIMFTKDELKAVKDPYQDHSDDPEYTDYVLNNMFNFQDDYEQDRKNGYVNFVKNKLHYFEVEFDYDSGDKDLFKTSTTEIVDLEDFNTVVQSTGGADIEKHAESTNIETSMKNLIAHLKMKTKFKIYYEKLDPSLIAQINDIKNEDVKNFHRDNFIFFKDFSPELKVSEMYKNFDETLYLGEQMGYNIRKKKL